MKQFELENTIFNVYVRFDGTYWLLNNSEDIEYSLLFYNTNTTGVVPPNDSWERGGCPDGTVRIETVLGVDVLDSKAISLLPNPSNNFIQIFTTNTIVGDKFEYKIMDTMGRKIQSGFSFANEKINIDTIFSGHYILEIKTENDSILRKKFIISR